jgi:hypothetical protein
LLFLFIGRASAFALMACFRLILIFEVTAEGLGAGAVVGAAARWMRELV